MSEPLAAYSFLPWLRQGLANNIRTGEDKNNQNDQNVTLRASIPVSLTISATHITGEVSPIDTPPQDVQLYGPGDIVGIDTKNIVKTAPHNWITNFEPNYLPYIEFYEEDFPWRYTPAHAANDHLRPWLTLVVLKEDEFEDGKDIKDKPLPYFTLKDGKTTTAIFPKPSELWAWAHVHVNADLSEGLNTTDTQFASRVTDKLTQLINQNPDHAYSRIISPRKLENNTGYHAFLIPSFESGRQAGLGVEPSHDLVATACAWDDPEPNHTMFPFYYRWYFKTGSVGDFEYLVNLLKPKPADKSIGVRDMDVRHPGASLPQIDDRDANGHSILGGILKLGGALKVPYATLKQEDKNEVDKYEHWDEPYPHVFTTAMARRINMAADYTDPTKELHVVNGEAGIKFPYNSAIGDPDPVISLPLYGCWHAMQKRLLYENDNIALQPNNKNWIHELNLDPRYRISAGLGTKVVQKNQEAYMQAAWEQVGAIVEANNKMRLAQMAKEVTANWYTKHVLPLGTEQAFVFTAPVQPRIIFKGQTVQAQVNQSRLPSSVLSGGFRSIMRPGGRIVKNLHFTDSINAGNLLTRINTGSVTVVPPKTDPKSAINLTDIAEDARPKDIPDFVKAALKDCIWFRLLPPPILALFKAIFGFDKWVKEITQAESLMQASQTPAAVERYPHSPSFVISSPGSTTIITSGNTDSGEAVLFKNALKDAFALVSAQYPEQEKKELPLQDITVSIVQSLNPALTITKRTLASITIPQHIKDNMVETFSPVWVYPVIDLPMYKPLADLSADLFLPNINAIEQNSITILENNQKFIEAYMVGLNHEMSRELLWREYPTDQRGSYFRQFWDSSGFLSAQPATDDTREKRRDIPPIDKWSKADSSKLDSADPHSLLKNELGSHNLRAQAGNKAPLVLIIRGEILKKYPAAVIYAQKAKWGASVSEERELITLTETEAHLDDKLKTPLFQSKIEPDIYFLGFDLDADEAFGTHNPCTTNDNPGWFFVIQERPGEPRFGLDITPKSRKINWNDFSWADFVQHNEQCIDLHFQSGTLPTYTVADFDTYTATDGEDKPVADDKQAQWNSSTNAAQLAYILYQEPVLVAVHASRMLSK